MYIFILKLLNHIRGEIVNKFYLMYFIDNDYCVKHKFLYLIG